MRQTYQLQWASKDLGQETRVALGDVNGDGSVNIVAGTSSAVSGNSNLYVFRFSGKAYHEMARVSLGSEDTRCIKVCDIDRDGKDEIIIGSDRGIFIYKMRGKELIRIAESTSVEGGVISLAVGDIDGDGRPEIVAAVKGRTRIYILRFDGKLVFVKSELFRNPVFCVATGDTDGDGHLEVVVREAGYGGGAIHIMSFMGGKRMEKWGGGVTGGGRAFLMAADLDGDGRTEVIFDCKDRRVQVLCHRGGAYDVMWESHDLGQDPRDTAVFDIDGDGQNELVIVGISSVQIFGRRGKTLALEWNHTIPNGVICVAAGELNQRGLGEIVIGTVYGYIYVMEARRDLQRGKLWVGKVQAIIQDTVEIPPGKPDAARGIEASARFSIDEVKVLWDKVIVGGEVTAKILYVAALPSQPVHFFEAGFPFLEFVHLYGADPGLEALVFFKVEHINVDVISPRRIKITVLFEMIVKLIKPHWDD